MSSNAAPPPRATVQPQHRPAVLPAAPAGVASPPSSSSSTGSSRQPTTCRALVLRYVLLLNVHRCRDDLKVERAESTENRSTVLKKTGFKLVQLVQIKELTGCWVHAAAPIARSSPGGRGRLGPERGSSRRAARSCSARGGKRWRCGWQALESSAGKIWGGSRTADQRRAPGWRHGQSPCCHAAAVEKHAPGSPQRRQ